MFNRQYAYNSSANTDFDHTPMNSEQTNSGYRFHPAVSGWFAKNFEFATQCQEDAWPAIQAEQDILVAAPTGSGKTLAAFLAVIDELIQEGLANGGLDAQVYVVYVSPLKALSYDIDRNLEAPLAGIREALVEQNYADVEIRTAVRTGDTTQTERQRMVRRPPHILVTTPESLYLLLTSESGRRMLQSVRKVIVDEIHALAGNKRGAHFSLSLARLEQLADRKLARIGLSATQKPPDRVASYLTGRDDHDCKIVDSGHVREWDLSIDLPSAPLEAVMATEVWQEVYRRIADLVLEHKTTLIFVNTRRHSERATRYLSELLGEENVTSHHGSLSKEHRRDAEEKLKTGQLQALVATASLELGIDIGDIDLVIQIGSPRSISVFLQRIGRSGHAVGKVPKGRIFPTTRDELVESAALLKSVNTGEMESLQIVTGALDVLAQQIVAEASVCEWKIDELFQVFSKAYPYRVLNRKTFDQIVQMLAEGFTLRRGRRGSYIHLDAVNKVIRGRRGARITAATNAGVIPDQFDFDVVLEPDDVRIGTLNEDFAFESLAGDIFQLGNASYRILQVSNGLVRVEDAKGLPPNIPFWFGEGRGRSDILSQSVSRLRQDLEKFLTDPSVDDAINFLKQEYSLDAWASRQIAEYLAASKTILGELPTREKIVLERFFDEAGDAHLVVHSVYGSRLNKAWGLALRKRFCVRFNFELQASALEDNLVLSLGPTHSFELEDVRSYLKSATARETLTQAIFTAPMFGTRWRWVANIALAIQRNRTGKKVPPPLQRADAEDLLALVFPDQLACQENLAGPIEVPDHPLVTQTVLDCLQEVMDANGLEELLRGIEAEEIKVICKDLPEPSPLAQEVLTARPYAFLDDAPAEERRTLAIQQRRQLSIADAQELSKLDPNLIDELRSEIWPQPKLPDEVHDALMLYGLILEEELSQRPDRENWKKYFETLVVDNRATRARLPNSKIVWVVAERLEELLLVVPELELMPSIPPAQFGDSGCKDAESALVRLLRSRLEMLGPATAENISTELAIDIESINAALLVLEAEGTAMRGYFTGASESKEWCERRFLARLHKRTLNNLRKQIKPVDAAIFTRFLTDWQRLSKETMGEGLDTLDVVIRQMEGFEAPVSSWESDILPRRVFAYTPELLDLLVSSGKYVWARLSKPASIRTGNFKPYHRGSLKMIPLTFLRRENLQIWRELACVQDSESLRLSAVGQQIKELLTEQGALFLDEIQDELRLLPTHVEEGLVELFSMGLVSCDHFGGMRALLTSELDRRKRSRLSRVVGRGVQFSGRWSLILRPSRKEISPEEAVRYAGNVLLNRYGVIFRDIVASEKSYFPSWFDLLKVFRYMEDRGDVRGGRFVDGFRGEQFAHPGAVEMLRRCRNKLPDDQAITVSATDPLNIASVTRSESHRITALPSNYLVFKDGHCISASENHRQANVS